jgi:hypothetical protein
MSTNRYGRRSPKRNKFRRKRSSNETLRAFIGYAIVSVALAALTASLVYAMIMNNDAEIAAMRTTFTNFLSLAIGYYWRDHRKK